MQYEYLLNVLWPGLNLWTLITLENYTRRVYIITNSMKLKDIINYSTHFVFVLWSRMEILLHVDVLDSTKAYVL